MSEPDTLKRGLNLTALLSLVLAVLMTLGSITFAVTRPTPTPVGAALDAYCSDFADNVRVTALSLDADETWTFAHVVGGPDTLGREVDEKLRGEPAEVIYPGEAADEIRQLGVEADVTKEPIEFEGEYNDVAVETRIVPVVDGLVLFCTEVNP